MLAFQTAQSLAVELRRQADDYRARRLLLRALGR